MTHLSVRVLGYLGTLLHGDPAVLDRWFFLRRHLRPGPLETLDAGCGSGAMAMYAAKIGNQALGVSLSERDNRVAEERAMILKLPVNGFVTADLRTYVTQLGKMDQIICFETIEHILDDRKLLRDFASILNPGGRLILTAPYKHYKRLPGDKLSHTEDGGHVRWGYTHKEMRLLLEEAGFKVKAEEYVSGYYTQLLIRLQRNLVLMNVPDKLAWLIVFPLRFLQVLNPLAVYPSLSIGVVATV